MNAGLGKTLYWMSVLSVAGLLAMIFPQRAAAQTAIANPAANNVPPTRNDQPNDANRGQQPADRPVGPPPPSRPANHQANQPLREETPQQANGRKAREKKRIRMINLRSASNKSILDTP